MNKHIGTYDKIEPLIDLLRLQINTCFNECEPGKLNDFNLKFSIEKKEDGKLRFITVKKNDR